MTFLCPLGFWWSKEHERHRNVFLLLTFMSDNDLNHSFSVFRALQKLLATRGSFWWSTHEYKFLKYADCLHCKAVNWLWTFCRVLNHLNLVTAWSLKINTDFLLVAFCIWVKITTTLDDAHRKHVTLCHQQSWLLLDNQQQEQKSKLTSQGLKQTGTKNKNN